MFEAPKLDQIGQDALTVADYIEEHGWCQNEYEMMDGSVCIRGAGLRVFDLQQLRFEDLMDALTEYLPACSVVDFNDRIATSKDEVLTKLREFAYNRQIKE